MSEAGTIQSRNNSHSISLCKPYKFVFPIDNFKEISIDQLATGAREAYLVDANDPESVICLDHGRHRVRGGSQVIVIESFDRLFIAPVDDCVLEYAAGQARLAGTGERVETVTVGVNKIRRPAIETGTGIDELFRAVSFVCSLPGETSPYRSHPLFRTPPPGIRLKPENMPPVSCESPIHVELPPDLRYLYAAAPLAYYLGATVETGSRPRIEAGGLSVEPPSGYRQFERWAGNMLSHTFQADCAVRCEAVTRDMLPGIDVQAITGYTPEELMLMTMSDRFLLYAKTLSSHRRAFCTWHMASYVEPVPSSVEIMPFLMRSLSAVYTAQSTRLSERDVVSLSVRNFKEQQGCRTRGDDDLAGTIVLPSLYNAQAQQWYSEGCPVDAALSGIGGLKNGENFARSRLKPEVCVICNEPPMAKEARLLESLLASAARVEVRMDLDRKDLLHTFSEGFDIVHYAGHCDRSGLKCRDGPVDLSSVGHCDAPVFFLNSCASYVQGARLIEKGAVCGITTMFRLLDEAALDVSAGFYRMLIRGYPIMTSYLAARECSVTGKEYLLIGDGFYRVFNGSSFLPFYKLSRTSLGFSLQCKMPGGDKGLIVRTGNGKAMADTGFEMSGVRAEDLPVSGPDGMCLYGSCIYDCVADAVGAALIDLKRIISAPEGKSRGPERRRWKL